MLASQVIVQEIVQEIFFVVAGILSRIFEVRYSSSDGYTRPAWWVAKKVKVSGGDAAMAIGA
jgi:hypothetical protein